MVGRYGDIVEEIRSKADLVAIASEYVQLRTRGRNLVGLCPFHEEKDPSFTINPEAQFWYCFGCHQGGDVFSFVQKVENLTFREALERLAERYQVPLPRSREEERSLSERERLRKVLEVAHRFYREQLQGRQGQGAREYLDRRGVEGDSIARFGLGYAPPEWEGLLGFLRRKGISPEEALQAGVAVKGTSGEIYDRFRDRLIFPIHDDRGRLIGFGGRALRPEQEPKYLNIPETPLFRKGEVLYGFHLAQRAIREAGFALMMEGYMDVLMAHQHGLPQAVGILGTALTPSHLRLLRRWTSRIVLCFDADSAGMRAMIRALPLLEEEGTEARVVPLPQGQDPDSLLRTEGREAFLERLSKAPLLVEYQIQQYLHTYEDRMQSLKRIVPLLAQVKDPLRRDALLRRAARWWVYPQVDRDRAAEEVLRQEVQRFLQQQPSSSGGVASVVQSWQEDPLQRHERRLLALLLQSPSLLQTYREHLAPELFSDPNLQEISQFLRSLEPSEVASWWSAARARLSPEALQTLGALATEEVSIESLRIRDIERGLEILRHQRRYREVRRLLRDRDSHHPSEATWALLQELQELKRMLGPYGLA